LRDFLNGGPGPGERRDGGDFPERRDCGDPGAPEAGASHRGNHGRHDHAAL